MKVLSIDSFLVYLSIHREIKVDPYEYSKVGNKLRIPYKIIINREISDRVEKKIEKQLT